MKFQDCNKIDTTKNSTFDQDLNFIDCVFVTNIVNSKIELDFIDLLFADIQLTYKIEISLY